MEIGNFNFWCPVEISKAIDPNTGEEQMLLGGIASTADEDSDGEFLDPKGFDIKPLLKSGMVNWHHQAKTCPGTIVGEPTKAEIRKDGLYIETKLYPSSSVARDIWQLAQTLEEDSSTRRLGYSIEGKVLERKSNDKSSPDYKKITKAVITGVAITHQPKNPKTFANIIKGEIDDDLDEEDDEKEIEKNKEKKKQEDKYYEGVNLKEKSLDTAEGKPLIKEDLDRKLKNVTFGKSDVMERLFQDIPGISIEKAKEVYILIQKISNMKKKNSITEEDIQKAYDALGLDPETLVKGDTSEEDEARKPRNTTDDEDEDVDDEEDVDDTEDVDDDEDTEDEDDDSDDEDEDEEEEEKAVKKGGIFDRFNRIEKALATSHYNNAKYIKALGVMVKASNDSLEKAISSLELANQKIDELNSINKAQEETISELSQRIESFGNGAPAPKSFRHAAPVERNLNKGNENDFEKGGNGNSGANTVSISNKPAISNILDQATFAKGYDDEFSKACLEFEATGNLPANVISRLKSEYNISIVK